MDKSVSCLSDQYSAMDKKVDCVSGQEKFQFSAMDKKVDCVSGQEKFQFSAMDKNVYQGKDVTQMGSEDLKDHFISSAEEFSSKMEENFKCYVFIAASAGAQPLDEVVQIMAYFADYQMHKAVGCSQRIYHLYVKYESESVAIAARDFLRNRLFHAEIVDDMLRLWYAYEKASGLNRCPTIGWLTIADGRPLTTESASQVLRKYGNPQIMDKSVRVSFNSIAEAFGASIALGPWYYNLRLADSNYYSVKIELTEHCSKIMSMCNMGSVASGFDYFVQNDPNVYTKTNVYSMPSNPQVGTITNDIYSLQSNEVEQPAKVVSRYGNRLNRFGQRYRNSGRIFNRHTSSYENIPFRHQQNRCPQTPS